jgi:hypothetical protein
MRFVARMAFMQYKKFPNTRITTNVLFTKVIFMATGKTLPLLASRPNSGILLQHRLWTAVLKKLLKLEKRWKSWDYNSIYPKAYF